MTWIKICGTTSLEDALMCVEAGADALGFVFYEKSSRNIDRENARNIIAKLPANIEKVGVFVNESAEFICKYADEAGLTAIQLHGDKENPQIAESIRKNRPSLKVFVALSMTKANLEEWARPWKGVDAFLADSGTSATPGGTGKSFDWNQRRAVITEIAKVNKIIVAGGLNAANVAEALHILEPWGVDVVSGVEKIPGKKDPEKVRAFIKAVREARK